MDIGKRDMKHLLQSKFKIIPFYQRNYSWTTKEWESFMETLLDDSTNQFFGAVVVQGTKQVAPDNSDYIVVDGQQRILSLLLVILASCAYLDREITSKRGEETDLVDFTNVIREDYIHLKNEYGKTVKLSIELPGADFNHYKRIVAKAFSLSDVERAIRKPIIGKPESKVFAQKEILGSRLITGYNFFFNKIQKEIKDQSDSLGVALDDEFIMNFFKTLKIKINSLQIINVEMMYNEDAQKIFESLNTHAIILQPGDLIKNFFDYSLRNDPKISEEESANQRIEFHKQWKDEFNTFWPAKDGGKGMTRFFQAWLISKIGKYQEESQILDGYKNYCDINAPQKDKTLSPKPVRDQYEFIRSNLSDLLEKAKFIKEITEKGLAPAHLNITKEEIFFYRTTVLLDKSHYILPFVLAMKDRVANKTITQQQYETMLSYLEVFIVRREICGLRMAGGNKYLGGTLLNFVNNFFSEGGKSSDLLKELATFLNSQEESSTNRIPNDDEFLIGLNREIYTSAGRSSNRPVKMLLIALEDHSRGFDKEVRGNSDARCGRDLNIEHIMPQNTMRNWGNVSPEEASLRKTLIGTLGNLTLLNPKANSSAGDASWDDKKNKLRDSSTLKIMLDWYMKTEWRSVEILERTKELSAKALEIWSIPKTP